MDIKEIITMVPDSGSQTAIEGDGTTVITAGIEREWTGREERM